MSVDVFEGRPVEGEVNHYTTGPGEQDDPRLFIEALDKLLATPGIEAVRWDQYTPYFNDGEACVFSIYGAMVKIKGDTRAGSEDGGEDYDDVDETECGNGFRTTYDLFDYDVNRGSDYASRRVFTDIAGYPSKMIYDALEAFESVLENGKHYVILNEKFGDPAQVTANKDGSFTVEYYEHD